MNIEDVSTRENWKHFKLCNTTSIEYWENNIYNMIRSEWSFETVFTNATVRQYWVIALGD